MHLVCKPLTLVLSLVLKVHHPPTFPLSSPHLAAIGVSVEVKILALACLFVGLVLSLKESAIWPQLPALAVSLILTPLSLVPRPTCRHVFSHSMGHILSEVPSVVVPIGMEEPTPSLRPVISELPAIVGAVREEKFAVATTLPL